MARLLGVIAMLASACGAGDLTPTHTPRVFGPVYYTVVNIDGPPVDVVVNGVLVTHLTCGMGGFDLLSEPGVPALPWQIVLVKSDGAVIYTSTVNEVSDFMAVVLRGDSAGEIRMPSSVGPVPRSPCPS